MRRRLAWGLARCGQLIDRATAVLLVAAPWSMAQVTHAMFLGDAQDAFRDAVEKGLMKELVCTNTLMQPKDFLNKNRYVKILDGLRLFAEAIFETYTGGSISRLYEAPLRELIVWQDLGSEGPVNTEKPAHLAESERTLRVF